MVRVKDKYFPERSSMYSALTKNILFLHAVSGCDTTNALFDKGKKKVADILIKYPDLQKKTVLFYNPQTNNEMFKGDLFFAGQLIIKTLYGWNPTKPMNLGNLRFHCYQKLTLKNGCN